MTYKFSFTGSITDININYDGWYQTKFNVVRVLVNGKGVGFMPMNPASDTRASAQITVGANLLKMRDNYIQFRVIDGINTAFAVGDMLVSKSSTDVVSSGITILPNDLKRDEAFLVEAKFNNIGRFTAPSSSVSFYLSNDAIRSSNDTTMVTRSVRELERNKSSVASTYLVTDKINKGYYVYACYKPHPSETNKSNNCTQAIELTGPHAGITPVLLLLLVDDES